MTRTKNKYANPVEAGVLNGWLSPRGDWWACVPASHHLAADEILGREAGDLDRDTHDSQKELEFAGWVRLSIFGGVLRVQVGNDAVPTERQIIALYDAVLVVPGEYCRPMFDKANELDRLAKERRRRE